MLRMPLIDGVVAAGLLSETMRPRLNPALYIVLGLAGVLIAAGIGVFGVLGYDWLITNYPRDKALAIVATVLLSTALILMVSVYASIQSRINRFKAVKQEMQSFASEALDSLDDMVGGAIRAHPRSSVLASLLAGFIAAKTVNI